MMSSSTKKGDKITSFVNHCYIIREQRARNNHKERKKDRRMHSILKICILLLKLFRPTVRKKCSSDR